MSELTKIAIVGRPNVGKSALFNSLCGKRLSIVDSAEGVTRDRLYGEAELFGRPFLLIDTGGLDTGHDKPFIESIRQQTLRAIQEADALIMVVDATVGVTELDLTVARQLQRCGKPLCLAINKVDEPAMKQSAWQFAPLGIEPAVPISALQRWQLAELLTAVLERAPDASLTEPATPFSGTKVAVVGRPNVGKSTLLNHLVNEERCLVSEIPGTTRDSIDLPLERNGKSYLFVDTAGIRRKKSEKEAVDKFAAIRTQNAIERCDLCLLMVDSQQGMTTQEKRIARDLEEAGRGCILLMNKWDLVKGYRMEHCLKEIERDVPFLAHCPKLFISAKSGRNIDKIFDEVDLVAENYQKRITTHQLNAFVQKAMQITHPPMLGGKRLRVYYMTQVEVAPPTFVLFVNNPDLMSPSYQKYLYNQFRSQYGFFGVPIRLLLRQRERRTSPT